MLNYRHNLFLIIGLVLVLLTSVSACTSSVEAPKTNFASAGPDKIIPTKEPIKDTKTKAIAQTNANLPLTSVNKRLPDKNDAGEIDLEQEVSIEKKCLAAWRKCTAGHNKEALADLKNLNLTYPNSASVFFMTGQVLDRVGDKEEALVYYQKAANNSDFAVMSLFKIAESLRTTGNTMAASERYKKLIAIAPQFSQAHLGLAKTLAKTEPEKAKKELETTLELEPSNREAKTLLNAYGVKEATDTVENNEQSYGNGLDGTRLDSKRKYSRGKDSSQ